MTASFCLAFAAGAYLLVQQSFAQSYDNTLPEEIRKNIIKGCHEQMSRKVLAPHISKAYCFCYAHELSNLFTEKDFDRMGSQGVSDRDQKYFKRARKICKPPKPKRGEKQALNQYR